jgi:hypothetical protein
MFAGLKYAGSRNGDAQELLYTYAVHFLNEVCVWLFNLIVKRYIGGIIAHFMQIKHIPVRTAGILPKSLLQYVDRGTLELCLHLVVLSLSLVGDEVYYFFFYLSKIATEYTLLIDVLVHILMVLHNRNIVHSLNKLFSHHHIFDLSFPLSR